VASTQDAEQKKSSGDNGGNGGGTKTMRYREALNEALREELQRDESVFVMGEDIGVFNGAFKVTQGLLEEFCATRRSPRTPSSARAWAPRCSACAPSSSS
jgi:pyruvate dehydrogenase E1 component beta subunit